MKRWAVALEPAELNGGLVWVARISGPRCALEFIDACGADALAGAIAVVRASRVAWVEARGKLN